jgi:hypothetical protein
MRRDGLSRREAQEMIAAAREEVAQGRDPEEVLEEDFGLEPDWVMDLL